MFSGNNDVKELNFSKLSTNGTPKVKQSNGGMMMIYASYCSFCHMVKPEWLKLAKEIKDLGGEVYAYQSDLPENTKFFDSYEVQGVPHIVYVSPNGEIDETKYMGERTSDDFMNYYKTKSSSKKKKSPKKKSTPKTQKGGGKKKPKKKQTVSKKKKKPTKKSVPKKQTGGAKRSKKRKAIVKKKKPSTKSPSKKKQSKKKVHKRVVKKIVIKKGKKTNPSVIF